MGALYQPRRYARADDAFGRPGCMWRLPSDGNPDHLAASVIQHAHAVRWDHLIGYGVRAFCQRQEIAYERFLDVLRGTALMRDADRAIALRVLGPDALPTDGEILDYLREAEEDTGGRLIARKPRRKFNPDAGEFWYQGAALPSQKYPPVEAAPGVQPSTMEKTHSDHDQSALLREVAIALYFDDDPIDYSNVQVEVSRDDTSLQSNPRVTGWFGAGAIRIAATLGPNDQMLMLGGLLIVEVQEHDEIGRPLKVRAARALPVSVGFPPYPHYDWEYATSPATIVYFPEPVALWEEEDIAKAAFAWAREGGRERRVGGTLPPGFDID